MKTPFLEVSSIATLVLCLGALGCNKRVDEPGKSDFVPAEAGPSTEPPGPAILQIEDVVVGKGAEAKSGDTISVHYTGTLMSGKKFDSSRDRGTPFEFRLNTGNVIKGWDQGVIGMKVGGRRKLTIPASLAYGAKEQPGIPPNSGLKFDIELLAIK
jgi:FKBP-type peptidyl-prolyl cis-trans isomerase